jgi:hypothetical protein
MVCAMNRQITFRAAVRQIARLYDMQHDPAFADVLTRPGP